MIEVKDLEKSFGDFKALDGASLCVNTGSIYGLVGPNGAGKSTIIRHLLGVYKQDAGSVKIDGQDIWENTNLKNRIASIPDELFYFNQASVLDMKKYYKGIYKNFSDERYEKLKEAFDINEKRLIRTLSKGMQKQVAFWLALSTMPDYLILDEPVDGLDPVMRRQVWSLIMGDVSERGTTVLVSSHNLRELEDVCDHVGIMNNGRIMLERSLTELQENMVKMQVVLPEEYEEFPAELGALNVSKTGRIFTVILRTDADGAAAALAKYNPVLTYAMPLTLEEIFIYEIGGDSHEVKDIIL